ncbi:MAG TPA: cupin domain-containing protein [Trebonia sp.]|jgi:quercetin dioxygenase-like cupin family protein|nr:cupin domain-containing protein [Trebonia sp.]
MEIEHGRKGTPSQAGGAGTFSGQAMLDPLLEDGRGEVRVNSVMFAPGGRTFWHSHAGGQVLLVASGHGLVETKDGERARLNPGDVVWAPPGEVHWHGAAPDSFINHTAISLGVTAWAEQVDDEHYGAAFAGE